MPHQPQEPNHAALHPATQRAMLAASVNYSMTTYDPHFFIPEEVAA